MLNKPPPSGVPFFKRSLHWRVDVYAEIGTGYRQIRKQLWSTHCPTRGQAEQAATQRAAREASSGWRRAHPDDTIAWFITSPEGRSTAPVRLVADPASQTFDSSAGVVSEAPITPVPFTLTPAQQELTFKALEIVIARLTQRAEVLALGEVCKRQFGLMLST